MDLTQLTSTAELDVTSIYVLVGFVVLGQLGTIVTVIIWLLKATWKASQMNSDIDRLKRDVNSAFDKIRGSDEIKNDDCNSDN